MSNKDRLYGKFSVRRVDGRDRFGGDKADARYFVLDYVHDRHARTALTAYADARARRRSRAWRPASGPSYVRLRRSSRWVLSLSPAPLGSRATSKARQRPVKSAARRKSMADVWLIIAAVWVGVPLAFFLVSFTVVALAIRSGRKAGRG